jgi:hypothetical protein
VCVRAREEGLGKDFSRFRTCYRGIALHSRFIGVAGVFQAGTMSTFGREVNWKSMGASVDRSDLGLWAIIRGNRALAGKHASRESLELVETKRVDHMIDTPFHHEARAISVLL